MKRPYMTQEERRVMAENRTFLAETLWLHFEWKKFVKAVMEPFTFE